MGSFSFVLAGGKNSMEETFGSACHGAGRKMSRHGAIKAAKGRSINRELEDSGIFCRSHDPKTLKEEMPDAYKDVERVVDVIHNLGIATKVARLRPLGVIKG
jgi:tRNA-splicing ligase RtcB